MKPNRISTFVDNDLKPIKEIPTEIKNGKLRFSDNKVDVNEFNMKFDEKNVLFRLEITINPEEDYEVTDLLLTISHSNTRKLEFRQLLGSSETPLEKQIEGLIDGLNKIKDILKKKAVGSK